VREIGISELEARAAEIVRDVRDRGTEYIITCDGQPVGVLRPLDKPSPGNPDDTAWNEFFQLREEVGRGWTSPLSTGELLSEMRR
jgi:prevent-host-death family protein